MFVFLINVARRLRTRGARRGRGVRVRGRRTEPSVQMMVGKEVVGARDGGGHGRHGQLVNSRAGLILLTSYILIKLFF